MGYIDNGDTTNIVEFDEIGGTNKLKFVDRALASPRPQEALIQMKAACLHNLEIRNI